MDTERDADARHHIDTLNHLIETCKDGEYGFRISAEHASTASLRHTFESRAEECRMGAVELDELISEQGGEAETRGTTGAALHRGWVAVKGTLAGYSDLSMLEECERGEDAALQTYRTALSEPLSLGMRTVVQRQFEGVERNHLQMLSLRDQARAINP